MVLGTMSENVRNSRIMSAALAVSALLATSCESQHVYAETVEDGLVNIVREMQDPPDVEAHSDMYGLQGSLVRIAQGVNLFVIDRASGIPIVLLNGGPGNSLQSFVPHFSRAEERSRIIYYDPRGVGRSSWEPGPGGYTTLQAIADLEQLRNWLKIERWVVLGWSWGGLLAQLYALEHPEHVLGLVLVASSESMGLERDSDAYVDNLTASEHERLRDVYSIDGQRVVPLHSDSLSSAKVRRLVFNAYLNGDWKRQFYVKPGKERMAHVAQHEWRHDVNYNTEMRATGFYRDLSGAFSDFNAPVLLVYGLWDMSFSKEMSSRLAAQFPDSELHVLKHSSHNPFASEPDKFFGILERWLSRLSTK